jgi:hypothetical protein
MPLSLSLCSSSNKTIDDTAKLASCMIGNASVSMTLCSKSYILVPAPISAHFPEPKVGQVPTSLFDDKRLGRKHDMRRMKQ